VWIMSQDDAEGGFETLRRSGIPLYLILYCSSRRDSWDIPPDCLICIATPARSNAPMGVFARRDVSGKFKMIKCVVRDKETKEKEFALLHKAAQRRDRESEDAKSKKE
jgi:hypothetical protein